MFLKRYKIYLYCLIAVLCLSTKSADSTLKFSHLAPKSILKGNIGGFAFSADQVDAFLTEGDFYKISFVHNLVVLKEGAQSANALKLSDWMSKQKVETDNNSKKSIMTSEGIRDILSEITTDRQNSKIILQILTQAENLFQGEPSLWYSEFYDLLLELKSRSFNISFTKFLKNYRSMLKAIEKKPQFRVLSSPIVWQNILMHTNRYDTVFKNFKIFNTAIKKMKPETYAELLDKSLLYTLASTGEESPVKIESLFNYAYASTQIKNKSLRDKIYNRNFLLASNNSCVTFKTAEDYYSYNAFSGFVDFVKKNEDYLSGIFDNDIFIEVADKYKTYAESVNTFLFKFYKTMAENNILYGENLKSLVKDVVLSSKDSIDCTGFLQTIIGIAEDIPKGNYPKDFFKKDFLQNIAFSAGGYNQLAAIFDRWQVLHKKTLNRPNSRFFHDAELLEYIVKFCKDRTNTVLSRVNKYMDEYPEADLNHVTYLAVFSLYGDFKYGNVRRFFELMQEGNINADKFDIPDTYKFLEANGYFNHSSVLSGMMPSDYVDPLIAEDNVKMIEQLDLLTAANNEAMKLLGGEAISYDITGEVLINVSKMLDAYNSIILAIPPELLSKEYLNNSRAVGAKLTEFKDYFKDVATDNNMLTKEDLQSLRSITGDLNSVQDIIISLHQNSIQMLFDYYTGVNAAANDWEDAGAEIVFNENIQVVDVLSQGLRERLSSAVLFLKDFFNHSDYAFNNERLKNIVLGNKVYHFFKMGHHTAKIALDLTSPQVGGHLLFQYNENTAGDRDGVPIRQTIVAEICRRMGMSVSNKGLNVNVVYNQESGISHVDELIDGYSKLWYLNKLLTTRELIGAGTYDNFHHSHLGNEYRERRDKSLPDNLKDEALIEEMVEKYTSLILKNVAENFVSADDIKQKVSRVFEGVSGERLDHFLQEEQVSGYETMHHVLTHETLRIDAYKNAMMFDGIKNMVKWEKEALVGKTELVSANIELGYNHNMTLYAIRDSETNELLLGWGLDNLTGKPVVDSQKLHQFVATESYYPLNKPEAIANLDIMHTIKPLLDADFYQEKDSAVRDKAKGLPVSEGVFEGEVILYERGKHKASDLTGKVVVVDYLTPEDDTVVRTAGALILLGGGNLSHGAIFAREMKIPAVILNNFNMKDKGIEGIIKILNPHNDKLTVGGDIFAAKKFDKEEKLWKIDQGFVLKVNGGKGVVSDIDAVKKELILLMQDMAANKNRIHEVVADNKELVRFLYDRIVDNRSAGVLRYELLEKYPELKSYRQEVLGKKKIQLKGDVDSLLDEMKSAKHKWKFFNKANALRKLIDDNKGDVLDHKEIVEIHYSIADALEKNEKLNWSKEEQREPVNEIDVDFMRLAEVDNSYMPVLGNKVAKLGEVYHAMENAGADVPSGVGLTSKFYDDFMNISYQGIKLRDEISLIMKGNHSASSKSQTIMAVIEEIKETPQYAALKERADKIYKSEWGEENVTLAVRSSAIRKGKQLEDTVGTAGLYESYMFVEPKDMFERVVDVWSSLYAERALNYYDKIMEGGVDESLVEELSMAVVVQEHIDSDKSGVVFSVNPADGAEKTVISSGLGQGEGVVQGTIDVDTFIVSRNGLVEEKYISDKRDMMIKDNQNKELIKVDSEAYFVDALGKEQADKIKEIIGTQVLSDKMVHKIAALAKYLQDYFGYPVDMEFAVKEKNLYLTQVRMITTMGVDEGKSFVKDILRDKATDRFTPYMNPSGLYQAIDSFSAYMTANAQIFEFFNIGLDDIRSDKESVKEQSVDTIEDTRKQSLTAA